MRYLKNTILETQTERMSTVYSVAPVLQKHRRTAWIKAEGLFESGLRHHKFYFEIEYLGIFNLSKRLIPGVSAQTPNQCNHRLL